MPQLQFPPGSPFEDLFKDFFDRQSPHKRKATSLGSGFVIDESGYIVTNNHVIGNADEIEVIFQDGTKLNAELVGNDRKVDLAVLKVESNKKLEFVKWGDSSISKVGDWVLAIGNPFGLGGTVTAGIISAKSRDIKMGQYDSFIQTDASINRGNSGGPMFNIKGEVIGINSAIFSPSGGSVGIGFAIPAEIAAPVIDQLKKFGKTKRGWLGVRIQPVTDDIAEAYGLSEPKGALVASVTSNSPSSKSGIKPGDIILEFDGKEISKSRDLPRFVASTKIGKKVQVVVWRSNKSRSFNVILGELESFEKIDKAQVIKNKRNGLEKKFIFPTICPSCNSNIVKNKSDARYYCVNNKCITKIKRSIEYFVSKNAMNIEGLGPSIIEKLVSNNIINNFADIYYLKKEDLLQLDGFGVKSAENLIHSIGNSKNRSSVKLLVALGINHIGNEMSDLILNKFEKKLSE